MARPNRHHGRLHSAYHNRPDNSSVTRASVRECPLRLFEWLSRFDDSGDGTFRDQAEQRVLWDIHAALESNLVAILDPQYDRLLAEVRDRVRDDED